MDLMQTMRTHKRQATMLSGVLIGTCVSILFTLILSLITAGMLNSEAVGDNSIRLLTCSITVAALVVGILTAHSIYHEKTAIVSIIVSSVYFLLLLCGNLLFFNGDFQGILPQMLSILGGSLIGILPIFRKKKSFKRKRISTSR